MQPPRLPLPGTCYEIDLDNGFALVSQAVAVRPVGRALFLAVFDGCYGTGVPVDLPAWLTKPVTHAFDLVRSDLECGGVAFTELGLAKSVRDRVPLPLASGPADDGDDWVVTAWDGTRQWLVDTAGAEPYPMAGGGSAVTALLPTMRECLHLDEDEDDCRYRLEAFFGESIPPEGPGTRLDVPAFDRDGSTGSWRTLVVQLTFPKPVVESNAALSRLNEIEGALQFAIDPTEQAVVGGSDFRPGDPAAWIYLHAHDFAPVTPRVRAVLDATKMANRYSLEEFDGIC